MLILRTLSDSADRSLGAARALLTTPAPRDATLAVLGSAALCAVCAIALASLVVLGPPVPSNDGGGPPAAHGAP